MELQLQTQLQQDQSPEKKTDMRIIIIPNDAVWGIWQGDKNQVSKIGEILLSEEVPIGRLEVSLRKSTKKVELR